MTDFYNVGAQSATLVVTKPCQRAGVTDNAQDCATTYRALVTKPCQRAGVTDNGINNLAEVAEMSQSPVSGQA